MSFRKRNVQLPQLPLNSSPSVSSSSSASNPSTKAPMPTDHSAPTKAQQQRQPRGTRLSPLLSRPTTSTGTQDLDALLALSAGQAMGTSLLIEEAGTTDYSGALLRCYAAEGVMQGHKVFVLGVGDEWARGLPGVVRETENKGKGTLGEESGEPNGDRKESSERMKIAWRYERLPRARMGEIALDVFPCTEAVQLAADFHIQGSPASLRPNQSPSGCSTETAFRHTFDLTTRLHPPPASPPVTCLPASLENPTCPLPSLDPISSHLSTNPTVPARVIIPSLLSPLHYSPLSSHPHILLHFLHSLRALLRRHADSVVALASWPLVLYPRSHFLTQWAERIFDGTITLEPFPHGFSAEGQLGEEWGHIENIGEADAGAKASKGKGIGGSGADPGTSPGNDVVQGRVKLWKVPIWTERGVRVKEEGVDWGFGMGRRKLRIRPLSLPPLEGEGGSAQEVKPELNF